ncbi:hypothetical protein SKAU_G00311390 [Synaphobranchus kaupii]|uniref:Uncharacterized protein n=1 Tax=Synaphobranchus kaupii TaxID=118154 RepID=A0A9Q1ILE2_SYNKA|nr:hypothetical protein SKAU_G00311390 [Synaphobranchus kaupii]
MDVANREGTWLAVSEARLRACLYVLGDPRQLRSHEVVKNVAPRYQRAIYLLAKHPKSPGRPVGAWPRHRGSALTSPVATAGRGTPKGAQVHSRRSGRNETLMLPGLSEHSEKAVASRAAIFPQTRGRERRDDRRSARQTRDCAAGRVGAVPPRGGKGRNRRQSGNLSPAGADVDRAGGYGEAAPLPRAALTSAGVVLHILIIVVFVNIPATCLGLNCGDG